MDKRIVMLGAAVVPFLLAGTTTRAAADIISVASVTCFGDLDRSCVDPGTTQASWAVGNHLSTFLGFGSDADLLNVNLTFDYDGGSRAWHWDVIHPTNQVVTTEFFDISLVSKLTALTLTATLPTTVFDPVFGGDPYTKFIASSTLVSASQSQFPPPLDVVAQGTFIRTTPEPGTLLLLTTGLAGAAIPARRWHRRDAVGHREGAGQQQRDLCGFHISVS